ncbi:MAG: class I SAM-dependent methyltransferase [Pseudomonadota bacterium]
MREPGFVKLGLGISTRWRAALRDLRRARARARGGNPGREGVERFAHEEGRPPRDAAVQFTPGRIADAFWSHEGPPVSKWLHYLEIYERYFERFAGREIGVLEIGVSNGGSLDLWRRFFGPQAVIFGVDVNPECARFDGVSGQVRIGSQDDAGFLGRVVDEMGRLDVVIDDGSHVMGHVRASFEALFPRMERGGVYLIEDMHTSYWHGWDGGLRRPGTAVETAKRMVDDLHQPYHERAPFSPLSADVGGIHFHDSIIVFDKGGFGPPRHADVGGVRELGL